MYGRIRDELEKDLEGLRTEGTYKDERIIVLRREQLFAFQMAQKCLIFARIII